MYEFGNVPVEITMDKYYSQPSKFSELLIFFFRKLIRELMVHVVFKYMCLVISTLNFVYAMFIVYVTDIRKCTQTLYNVFYVCT